MKATMNGNHLYVSDEVYQERLEVCKTCSYYDESSNRCKHCGCFLEQKARFSLDSCPIGSWDVSDKDWIENNFEQAVHDVENPKQFDGRIPFPSAANEGDEFIHNEMYFQFRTEIQYEIDSETGEWLQHSAPRWVQTIPPWANQ